MSTPLEEYALLGDTRSAALVTRAGSVDWLGFPRFDAPTFFTRLLGTEEHGHWSLAPKDPDTRTTRQYCEGTLVLQSEHTTSGGVVRVTDALSIGEHRRPVRL